MPPKWNILRKGNLMSDNVPLLEQLLGKIFSSFLGGWKQTALKFRKFFIKASNRGFKVVDIQVW